MTNASLLHPRSHWIVLALTLTLLVSGCGRTAAPEPTSKGAAGATYIPPDQPESKPGTLEYLDVPLGGAAATDKLPLVIAIHGLGDTPQNFSRWLLSLPLRVRLILPQAPTAHGRGYSWFRYNRPPRSAGSSVAPPTRELARGMAAARDRLIGLLDQLEAKYPGLRAPALLGFSQGGMLSFALAARYPQRFSLVLPLSGVLPPELMPSPLAIATRSPVIHAFHGEADAVVPITPTANAVDQLKRLGYSASLERCPGVEHQIPDSIRRAVFEDLSVWLTHQVN